MSQPTESQKIFASSTYIWLGINNQNLQELQKLTPQKNNHPVNEWANDVNRQFSKELQMPINAWRNAQQKEMQIRTTLRFHFTPVRMAIIKNTNNNNKVRMQGEKNPYPLSVGM
jgi:hypothetical protein